VKAILNFRLFRFPPTRLLLGLYDYIFKHLAVVEEEECDIITTLQVDGLAQFFGLQELESRMTLFQEGEGDEDILARYVRSHEDHSPANINDRNNGPLTQSHAKEIQEQVNLFLAKLNLEIFKNVILPKIRNIYLDKVYTRRSYCWTKRDNMVYIEAEPTHHLADSTD